jgi:hypothetical protein
MAKILFKTETPALLLALIVGLSGCGGGKVAEEYYYG